MCERFRVFVWSKMLVESCGLFTLVSFIKIELISEHSRKLHQ